MMLIEETPVPGANLPVDRFKEHLRLGTGFADDVLQDGLIESFLRTALAAIEARTGKALMERMFQWQVKTVRGAEQVLPIAPVSAVAELVLLDRDGGEALVDPAQYSLRPDAQDPVLAGIPAIPDGGSARVRMLAGFGPDWSDLPADLAHAVFLLAAHYYEYRHEIQYDGGCMPFGVSALIERYRPVRIGARV